jgi:O-antigen ligase
MTSIAKHPLLGYGFYAFWEGLTGESANVILAAHWMFGYAHNGLLEIVLQLGLVGTGVFLLTFVNGCKDAWYCIKYGRTPGVEWYCGLLVLAVLYNVDEETVLWPNDLLSILYVVACCGLAVEAARIRRARAAANYALDESDSLNWDSANV